MFSAVLGSPEQQGLRDLDENFVKTLIKGLNKKIVWENRIKV
jgi:hypothetical protein